MKVYNETVVDGGIERQDIDMECSLGITFELDSGLRVKVPEMTGDTARIATPDGVLWVMPGASNVVYVRPTRRI